MGNRERGLGKGMLESVGRRRAEEREDEIEERGNRVREGKRKDASMFHGTICIPTIAGRYEINLVQICEPVRIETINSQVNKHLSRPRLRHIQLNDLGRDGTGLVINGSLVFLGKFDIFGRSHDV